MNSREEKQPKEVQEMEQQQTEQQPEQLPRVEVKTALQEEKKAHQNIPLDRTGELEEIQEQMQQPEEVPPKESKWTAPVSPR